MRTRLLRVSVLGIIFLAAILISSGFTSSEKSESNCIVIPPTAFEAKDELETDRVPDVFQNRISSQSETEPYTCSQSQKEYETTDTYLIPNFEIVSQMPELPTGCEITALTMVLNYYDYQADKTEIATEYLPTVMAAMDCYMARI